MASPKACDEERRQAREQCSSECRNDLEGKRLRVERDERRNEDAETLPRRRSRARCSRLPSGSARARRAWQRPTSFSDAARVDIRTSVHCGSAASTAARRSLIPASTKLVPPAPTRLQTPAHVPGGEDRTRADFRLLPKIKITPLPSRTQQEAERRGQLGEWGRVTKAGERWQVRSGRANTAMQTSVEREPRPRARWKVEVPGLERPVEAMRRNTSPLCFRSRSWSRGRSGCRKAADARDKRRDPVLSAAKRRTSPHSQRRSVRWAWQPPGPPSVPCLCLLHSGGSVGVAAIFHLPVAHVGVEVPSGCRMQKALASPCRRRH